MASTFLARLRIGPRLVDAKGVSQLYRSSVRSRDVIALVLSALFVIGIVSVVMPPMRLFWQSV